MLDVKNYSRPLKINLFLAMANKNIFIYFSFKYFYFDYYFCPLTLEIIESFFDDDCINLSDITEALTTNHSLW